MVKDFQPIFGNGRGRAGLLLQFHPNDSNNAAVYCRELHTIVGWYISISYHFVCFFFSIVVEEEDELTSSSAAGGVLLDDN